MKVLAFRVTDRQVIHTHRGLY